jgi:type IV secretion system protein VirB10
MALQPPAKGVEMQAAETQNSSPTPAPLPPKVDPESLALRAAPQAVMRLNRRLLIVLAALLAGGVLGALLWSLQPRKRTKLPQVSELYNVDRASRAEKLDELPKDYGKLPSAAKPAVPQLGPPLPGDLGPAILHAQQRGQANGAPGYNDAAQAERMAQVRDAQEAAKSTVFFRGSNGTGVATANARASAASTPSASIASPEIAASMHLQDNAASVDPSAVQNRQDQKEAFLAKDGDARTRQTTSLQTPLSPYEVMAGTVIAAALVTGINSDLPGQVVASVTQPVYDTASGRYLLIPQGSKLIGRYDSQIAFGQQRVLLVWIRLILPDASSIALDKLPGVDPAGYAGVEDGVDWHWDRLLSGAALSTLIGVGAELAASQNRTDANQVILAAHSSAQDTVNQAGQEITKRNLDVQPTLTIRPGFPVNVMVTKDLILRPYQPLFFVRGAAQ